MTRSAVALLFCCIANTSLYAIAFFAQCAQVDHSPASITSHADDDFVMAITIASPKVNLMFLCVSVYVSNHFIWSVCTGKQAVQTGRGMQTGIPFQSFAKPKMHCLTIFHGSRPARPSEIHSILWRTFSLFFFFLFLIRVCAFSVWFSVCSVSTTMQCETRNHFNRLIE